MARLSIILWWFLFQSFAISAFTQEGKASWYGGKFHGRKTASGETYDMYEMTAAHRSLPFGTIVDVYNLDNGKTVRVRINDRGPFVKDRIIDLSRRAGQLLGIEHIGTANVRLNADGVNITQDTLDRSKREFITIQVAAYKNPLNAKKMKERVAKANVEPVAVLTKEGIIRIEIRSIHRDDLDTILEKLERVGISSTIVKNQF